MRHIQRVLPQDVAKTLASSIVSSRLDYCNGVLYWTPNSTTQKLKKVQNQKSEIIYFGVAANGWIDTMLVNC